MIIAQQLPLETWRGLPRVCWNRRVPPSGLWLCGTPAAANVFLLCGHGSVSPRTAQETCPVCACGQKTTLRTPRWVPLRASAPHRKSRPAAQRSGGHQGEATRKATGDPATHGGAGDKACEQEQCVGTCDRGLKEGPAHRRCGTSPLHSLVRAVAAEQGTPTAQPLRAMDLLLGLWPLLLALTVVLGGELRDGSRLRGCEVLCDQSRRCLCTWRAVSAFSLLSPPAGCGGKLSNRTEFPDHASSPALATVGTRTFSVVRKSAAFPCYRLTAALSGFASGRLAGASGGGIYVSCWASVPPSSLQRYPVPTGTRLTGGVHRCSGVILVVLHRRNSTIESLSTSAGETDAV